MGERTTKRERKFNGKNRDRDVIFLLKKLKDASFRKDIIERHSRHKLNRNSEGWLPEGKFMELNVTCGSDPRRLLLNEASGEVYLSKYNYSDHNGFNYLGNINSLD